MKLIKALLCVNRIVDIILTEEYPPLNDSVLVELIFRALKKYGFTIMNKE